MGATGGGKGGYINQRDMFDGGGPGKSGDKFEGGGLLSAIANMIAKPLPPIRGGNTGQPLPPKLAAAMSGQPVASSRGYSGQPYSAPGDVQEYTYGTVGGPGRPSTLAPAGSDIHAFTSGMDTYTAKNPARPMVGQNLFDVIGQPPQSKVPTTPGGPVPYDVAKMPPSAPGSSPRPMPQDRSKATSEQLLRMFQDDLSRLPGAASMRDTINGNPEALEKLLKTWVMNGYRLPGM